MKVALVGCGFIGQTIARAIKDDKIDAKIVSAFDRNRENSREVEAMFDDITIADTSDEILESDADMVIEAASVGAVKELAIDILKSKKNLMVMSAGAFADEKFFESIKKIAKKSGVKVYIPSGAVGGLDALKSAAAESPLTVSLITVKPPKSLRGNQYLIEKGIDVDSIEGRQIVYEGTSKDTIEKFPLNANVAVTVGLCGVGPENTHVRIVCDPGINKNIHEIHVKGEFGEFRFNTKNIPSPENPKTSYLAALSAIATLKRITSSVEVGT